MLKLSHTDPDYGGANYDCITVLQYYPILTPISLDTDYDFKYSIPILSPIVTRFYTVPIMILIQYCKYPKLTPITLCRL